MPAYLVHGHASAPTGTTSEEDAGVGEATYSFTGTMNGAGRALCYGVFGLAQGTGDVGSALRVATEHLLRDTYLPLLPWDATERPNTLDVIASVVNLSQEALTGLAIAVILDQRAYIGWHGEGRAYLLTDETIEHLAAGSTEVVASHTLTPGASILLCSSGLWRNLPDAEIHEVVTQAGSVQEACSELVNRASWHDSPDRPLVLIVRYPE